MFFESSKRLLVFNESNLIRQDLVEEKD